MCWWMATGCRICGGLGKALTARAIIGGDATHAGHQRGLDPGEDGRDSYMNQMDAVYPAYCFAEHKGYAHARSSAPVSSCMGPVRLHRRSFEPVRLAAERADS